MNLGVITYLALIVASLALLRALFDHVVYGKRVRELKVKILEAQTLLKQRSTLASEIAHEIKNPITAILCSVETLDLLIGESLEEDHRRSLHFIRDYGDQVLRLVSDFLDLSRAEAGHLTARPEAIRLVPVIEAISALLYSNSLRKNIKVTIETSDPSAEAIVDPRHIKQIVFNLLHNAIKFTPPGGIIRVFLKREVEEPRFFVEIKDSGPGIAPEKLTILFDPYQNDDGKQNLSERGYGLGLALSKKLVSMSGGAISVSSTLGEGSTFRIELPAPKHEWKGGGITRVQSVAIDGRKQPLLGRKVLLVNEDLGSREAVARLIEAWGGVVDRVSLAVDAVEALTRSTYDTVVIDDEHDGTYASELSQVLTEGGKGSNPKIIIASKTKPHPELLRVSGANGWVEKPLSGKVLLKKLMAAH